MPKFRKKPVEIEAVMYDGTNHAEIFEFTQGKTRQVAGGDDYVIGMPLVILTLEGDHEARPGDVIIKSVTGEFYPCKPDIFAETYEPAD